MTYRDPEEIEKRANERVPETYNITPSLNQSVVIFVSFLGLTCCVMLLAACG